MGGTNLTLSYKHEYQVGRDYLMNFSGLIDKTDVISWANILSLIAVFML